MPVVHLRWAEEFIVDVYQGMKDFDFMAKHFKRRARQVAAP